MVAHHTTPSSMFLASQQVEPRCCAHRRVCISFVSLLKWGDGRLHGSTAILVWCLVWCLAPLRFGATGLYFHIFTAKETQLAFPLLPTYPHTTWHVCDNTLIHGGLGPSRYLTTYNFLVQRSFWRGDQQHQSCNISQATNQESTGHACMQGLRQANGGRLIAA